MCVSYTVFVSVDFVFFFFAVVFSPSLFSCWFLFFFHFSSICVCVCAVWHSECVHSTESINRAHFMLCVSISSFNSNHIHKKRKTYDLITPSLVWLKAIFLVFVNAINLKRIHPMYICICLVHKINLGIESVSVSCIQKIYIWTLTTKLVYIHFNRSWCRFSCTDFRRKKNQSRNDSFNAFSKSYSVYSILIVSHH